MVRKDGDRCSGLVIPGHFLQRLQDYCSFWPTICMEFDSTQSQRIRGYHQSFVPDAWERLLLGAIRVPILSKSLFEDQDLARITRMLTSVIVPSLTSQGPRESIGGTEIIKAC